MPAIARDFSVKRDGDQDYAIVGTVDAPEDDWTIEVVADNEGIVPQPTLAAFRLTASGPETGIAVITPVPVNHPFRDAPELETVSIRLVGAESETGESRFTLTVE